MAIVVSVVEEIMSSNAGGDVMTLDENGNEIPADPGPQIDKLYVLVDPPVGPYSPVEDIKAWIAELKSMEQSAETVAAIKSTEELLKRSLSNHKNNP